MQKKETESIYNNVRNEYGKASPLGNTDYRKALPEAIGKRK